MEWVAKKKKKKKTTTKLKNNNNSNDHDVENVNKTNDDGMRGRTNEEFNKSIYISNKSISPTREIFINYNCATRASILRGLLMWVFKGSLFLFRAGVGLKSSFN